MRMGESWLCAMFRCMVDVTVTIKFKVASWNVRGSRLAWTIRDPASKI